MTMRAPWRRGATSTTKPTSPPPATSDDAKSATSILTDQPAQQLFDDELSTTVGSSDGEHEEDSLPSPAKEPSNDTVVGRDLMLLHRSFFLRAPVPQPTTSLRCMPVAKAKVTPAKATRAPPGLSLLTPPAPAPAPLLSGFAPPPGLERPSNLKVIEKPTYSPPAFRKEMMSTFKELAADRNVAKAVRRIRGQCVPQERQAAEFADAVTYVMEEPRGCARRSFVAFVVGLVAAFDKTECAAGLEIFFSTVYPDLLNEVPKLAKIVSIELLPTLGSIFSSEEMKQSS